MLPVNIEGRESSVYVLLRPGAIEFCERMGQLFEVVIFTASLSKYAEPLVRLLDKKKWCSHILFREHCTYLDEHESYVKDLSLLGRDLKDVIIIDNSPTSYLFHPENALPSQSWYEDEHDGELYEFIPILETLSKLDDVRPALT
jgi:Dullard-like phosphatase family protein